MHGIKKVSVAIWLRLPPFSVRLTRLLHQIKRQATRNVGCPPSDCRWPVNLPPGLVWECKE